MLALVRALLGVSIALLGLVLGIVALFSGEPFRAACLFLGLQCVAAVLMPNI